MFNRCLKIVLCVMCACVVSACALSPHDPARAQQYVAVVNSLTWTNPLTGKIDGLRTSWPLKDLSGKLEIFPLAQIRQCEVAGAACRWGVMHAQRTWSKVNYVPGGVTLDLDLAIDIDRRQEVHQPGFDALLAIPSDVAALRWKKELRQSLILPYGKVERIDFDNGMHFEVCTLRFDAAGRALDICEIPYI